MKTIYKYLIQTETTLLLPKNAKVLCVQMQDDQPHIWVELDPIEGPIERYFETFGTGYIMPIANRIYIGTFQFQDSCFHLYERVK